MTEQLNDGEGLPRDPHGWRIELTDDGLWLPVRLVDETPLEPCATKAEAVAAIESTG